MSLCGLRIALGLVFGFFLLLALASYLHYFLRWRNKRRATTTTHSDIENMGHWGCWKIPRTVHADVGKDTETTKVHEDEENEEKDFVVMSSSCEEGVESELKRLHNLAGPPRFLFTIKEETMEDLESEDGKSKRGSRTGSLSDIMMAIETNSLDSYKHQGLNPLFESSAQLEPGLFDRFRPSSPPPKFKFMRDAEEKLYRRLIEEARKNSMKNNEFGVKDSCNSTIETGHKEFQQYLTPQFHSSGSSQVLPLASSPTSTTFLPLEKASSMVH